MFENMENKESKINVLSQTVVNKIAAGEVIERPASVVKELVENSIDAGSTKIDIHLEDSGKKLIKVSDDGTGMSKVDVSHSILSHSTSKLGNVEDICTIKTLGFRGEALPSIGAVSRLTIMSRTKESVSGAEICVDGGMATEVKDKGCSAGTQVEVRDLFFNTPVRRKFLKSNPVEMSHISECVTRVSLAHPEIHFNLYHNGRSVFNLPSSSTIKERIITFFGGEIGKNMIPVKSVGSVLIVKGYILPPSHDSRTTKMQYVFINGRYVRDKSIFHAIGEAYRGMLMSNRKPIVFLFLEIDPREYDVNVHPTKIEVRFKNISQIFGKIVSSIKEKLISSDLVMSSKIEEGPVFQQNVVSGYEKRDEQQSIMPAGFNNSPVKEQSFSQPNLYNFTKPDRVESQTTLADIYETQNTPPNIVVAKSYLQVQDSYIVEESANGINIIDQHALHEIILYEEIRQKAKESKVFSQKLLIPEPIELSPGEFYIIINIKEKLERLGFVIEEFGQNTVIVRAYPQILKDIDCNEFIKNLLSEIDESICKEKVDDCMDKLARITACRGAVKMGQKLKEQEVVELLEKRDKMIFSNNCPHGRPTTILMSYDELEKHFKRR